MEKCSWIQTCCLQFVCEIIFLYKKKNWCLIFVLGNVYFFVGLWRTRSRRKAITYNNHIIWHCRLGLGRYRATILTDDFHFDSRRFTHSNCKHAMSVDFVAFSMRFFHLKFPNWILAGCSATMAHLSSQTVELAKTTKYWGRRLEEKEKIET